MSDPDNGHMDQFLDSYADTISEISFDSSSVAPPSLDSSSSSHSSFVISSPEVVTEESNEAISLSDVEILDDTTDGFEVVRNHLHRYPRRIVDVEIVGHIIPDAVNPNEAGDIIEINAGHETDLEIRDSSSEIDLIEVENLSVMPELGLYNGNAPLDDGYEVQPVNADDNITDIRVIDNSDFFLEDNAVPGTSSFTSVNKESPKSPVLTKIRRRTILPDDSGEDGQTCSICFEPWGNSGQHRIASLKCGHLFGKECIERWLKGSTSRCPQCNATSSRRDIRVLYAKSIRVLDTTEKDRLAEELVKIKSEKVSLERKHAQVVINNAINAQLITKLQGELRMLKDSLKTSSIQTIDISGSVKKVLKLALYKSFDLSSGCRVMCYNEWLNMLIVSVSTSAGMFPGCGVKKINLFDMRIDKYIHIHLKQIKDMAFNPLNHEVLLSVAMDHVIKITNVCSNATLHLYKMNSPLFSCCWKTLSSTEFYIGTGQGRVLHYNTSSDAPIDMFSVSGSGPVVALCHIPSIDGFNVEGLLIVRLDSISFMEFNLNKNKEHKIDIEGTFTGLHYDPESKHILINCRPSQRHPHARHLLCTLESMEIDGSPYVELRNVYTFLGSSSIKMLSRSSIVCTMFNRMWVIINEESTLCAKLYDASSFELVQRIQFSSNVLQCLLARVQNECYIIFLTEKKAHLYKLLDEE